MVSVIKGDIAGSRKLKDQSIWMDVLRCMLEEWGSRPKVWDIVWGDSFQVQVDDASSALLKALMIKAAIKQIRSGALGSQDALVDVRLAIGIGDVSFQADHISERNGSAFVHAAESFDRVEQEKQLLGIQTPWPDVNRELYVLFRLLNTIIDEWTISAAELASLVLRSPSLTQKELGAKLNIAQNSVSYRYKRAKLEEVQLVLERYRYIIEKY